ncbi:MAG: hypothetical protein ACOC3V_04965, partial [bacterium]
ETNDNYDPILIGDQTGLHKIQKDPHLINFVIKCAKRAIDKTIKKKDKRREISDILIARRDKIKIETQNDSNARSYSIIKYGFHVYFPNMVMSSHVREYFTDIFSEYFTDEKTSYFMKTYKIPYMSSPKNMVDKNIIKSVPVMLYG